MKSSVFTASLAFSLFLEVTLAGQGAVGLEARAPAPSAAPNAELVKRNLLKHRAVTADGISTCFFESANPDAAITCRSGYECAVDAAASQFGCCPNDVPLSSCYFPTTCYDSSYYYSVLPRTVYSDELACSSAAAPVCKYFYDPVDELFAYGCDTVFETESVFYTASGSTVGPGTVTDFIYVTPAAATTAPSQSSAPGSGSIATTTPAPSSSTIPVSPVQSSQAPITASSSGLSTGAVVGIACAGAVVALGAIFGIGCVCFQRYRRNRDTPIVVAPLPPPAQPQVTTIDSPTGFNYVSKPVDDTRFSGSTYATEHYGPNGKVFDDRPISPHEAQGEYDIGSTVMSNAGHTVTSVASEGYNPPRV